MRPIEHYEALLATRRRVLEWVRGLTSEEFLREFPFGHKSVRATLAHLAGVEWFYGRAVRGEVIDPENTAFNPENYPDLDSLEKDWKQVECSTRAWLEADQDFGRRLERTTTTPEGKRLRIVYSPEKVAFQMFYHEVHHRSQVMAMLKLMGHSVGNVDFSRQVYEWIELE